MFWLVGLGLYSVMCRSHIINGNLTECNAVCLNDVCFVTRKQWVRINNKTRVPRWTRRYSLWNLCHTGIGAVVVNKSRSWSEFPPFRGDIQTQLGIVLLILYELSWALVIYAGSSLHGSWRADTVNFHQLCTHLNLSLVSGHCINHREAISGVSWFDRCLILNILMLLSVSYKRVRTTNTMNERRQVDLW